MKLFVTLGGAMARETYIRGEKIAQRRNFLSLTQGEVGARVGGMSDENVGRIERQDVSGILTKQIPALAKALEVPLDEFHRDYVAPKPKKPKVWKIALPFDIRAGIEAAAADADIAAIEWIEKALRNALPARTLAGVIKPQGEHSNSRSASASREAGADAAKGDRYRRTGSAGRQSRGPAASRKA